MGWASPGWVSMQLKSMVSAARRGGVPVFRRPRANPDCRAEGGSCQVLTCQQTCGCRQQQAVRPASQIQGDAEQLTSHRVASEPGVWRLQLQRCRPHLSPGLSCWPLQCGLSGPAGQAAA